MKIETNKHHVPASSIRGPAWRQGDMAYPTPNLWLDVVEDISMATGLDQPGQLIVIPAGSRIRLLYRGNPRVSAVWEVA